MAPALLALLALLVQEAPARPAGLAGTEYAARRDALCERFPGEVILVPCEAVGEGMEALDENTPLLDFTYLAGVQPGGAVLVLGAGEDAIFFANGADAPGIETVLPLSDLGDFVRESFQAGDRVRLWQTRGRGSVSGRVRDQLQEVGVTVAGGVNAAVTGLRVVKSDAEIALMRYSAEVTCRAHRNVLERIRPGMNEREVQEIIEGRFRADGCERNAFPCIVGSGPNSCILHYERNVREMEDGDLVVIDIGSEYRGYATDITRTLPVSGRFTDRQREIYQIVRDAQTAAEGVLRAGITLQQLDAAARRVIAQRGYGRYFIHHTTHYVGLAVHDSGSYGEPLPAGAVVVIEPGIYLQAENLGVRIEDTYLVTAEGWERLSETAPREIDELERR